MFVGRYRELKLLGSLFDLKKASIVVCKGRRRIGKSTLIQKFGEQVDAFYDFQGIAPRKGIANKDQLEALSLQIFQQTSLPKLKLESWYQAFSLLKSLVKDNEKTVIFLDEISWMAEKDKDFAGQLKIIWDTELKKKNKLILVLCGSITSWIDDNILNNTGFMGRVSLEINLDELSLSECNSFFSNNKDNRIDASEKLKILSITGGVPRYLEEINTKTSAEQNVKNLCFNREGILFSEFDKIFNDIFTKNASVFRKIIFALVSGSKTLSEISALTNKPKNGHLSKYLEILATAGFISKDTVYKIAQKNKSKLCKYRLKDNYLRFYLKYIEPMKDNIKRKIYEDVALENLVEWEVIMGFQFENLILNNIKSICALLSLNMGSIISAAPYFQRKTQRQEACQIDLLIQTKYCLYICEIKNRKKIAKSVINQVKNNIAKLKIRKGISFRPVLIYSGILEKKILKEDFFDKIICFTDLLKI